MKKSVLKVFSLVIVLMLVFSMFAGCKKDEGTKNNETTNAATTTGTTEEEPNVYPENGLPKDEKVTIKFGFADQGYGRECYDNMAKSFSEKFPNVTFEKTASPTIDQIVKTKVAAGDDNDMFHMMYYGWTLLIPDKKVEPLDDLLQRDVFDKPGTKLIDAYTPGIPESLSYYSDGHIYELPFQTYVGGLFFDKTLFEEHGWNQNPKTWTEFLKLCEDIKATGITPIGYAGMYDYESFAFRSKGAELAHADGKTDYIKNWRSYNFGEPFMTDKYNSEMWRRLYEMGQKGYIDPASVTVNHTESQMLAMQHKVAMVPSGDWIGNEMKDSTPEGLKWGFMGVPFTDDPEVPIYLVNGASSGYVVYSKKPDLEKNWTKEFYLWMMNLSSQEEMAKAGALSVRGDYGDDPARVEGMGEVQKAVSQYIADNNVKVFAVASYDTPLTHPSAGKAQKVMLDNNALICTGKKDPGPVMAEYDALIKEAYEAFKAEAAK